MLSLREMEVLHAVLATGGMSAAARQLRISQPAVSRAVAAAEQRLRVQLFLRQGNRLEATAELEELRGSIGRIFRDIDSLKRFCGLLEHGAGRVLRIAATPSLANAFIPHAVAAVRARFSHLTIHAKIREPGPIQEAVARRDFDLGIVYHEHRSAPVSSADTVSAPVVCLMPEGHRLAALADIGPADLRGETLISFAPSSTIGTDLDRLFAEHGQRRDVAIQIGNAFMAAPFVQGRLGVALVDPFILGSPTAAGLVARPFLPRRLVTPRIVWAVDRQLTAPERCLADALHAHALRWADEHLAPIWAEGCPGLHPAATVRQKD
ncbi:LysR family transcriptional regulator [Rubrimonas sp.]|uniref:LysR family transcriptional regulator n=1 Tax=Rubrimonas sp. TaxID=2036015 RepID=UPI002FDE1156